MYKRSIKKTLYIYLAYAWLVSSILLAIVVLMEYSPSTQKAVQRFGIGALVLDCIFWELLFTITGALSILNTYEPVQKNLLLSFFSFTLLPFIVWLILLSIGRTRELFGASEAGVIFLITQTFFFFKFRRCIKSKTVLSVN